MKDFLTTNLIIFAIKQIAVIFRFLPLNFACRISRKIGFLIILLCKKEKNIALAQIHFALGNKLSEEQIEKIATSCFSHICQAVTEAICIKKLLRKENNKFFHIESENIKLVKQITSSHKGCLALSGHIGCFELLAAYYAAENINISVVARSQNYKFVQHFVKNLRLSYGVETILREDPASAKKFLTAFKTGRVVAALIDQDTALESEYAPFFNLDTASPSSLIKRAVKSDVPILSSFIVRINDHQHQIISEEIKYDPNNPNVIKEILTIFNSRLEKLIRKYPEQWLWWHRRWRRRPEIDYNQHPEKLHNSKQYIAWMASLKK